MDNIVYAESARTLCEVLAERVKSYKRKHPRLNSHQVAKRFNMSASSLTRIMNGDIRTPSIDQVLRVLRGTGCDDILAYLEEYFPEVAGAYKDIYRSMRDKVKYSELHAEEYLSDDKYFRILLICFSRIGTTRNQIFEAFGQVGVLALDHLNEREIVKVDEDGRVRGCSDLISFSDKTVRNVLSKSVMHCSDLSFRNSYNFLSYHSESISKEGQKKIQEILFDANEEIKKIISMKEYEGDMQVYVGLVSDLLMESKQKEKIQ